MSAFSIKDNRFYWLDWIRFLAALMVLIVHARHAAWVDYGELHASSKNLLTQILFLFTRMGKEAVIVFFVMSGYLVGGGVIARLLSNTFDLKKYIVDRVTRIYIPLIPSMVLAGLVSYAFLKNDYSLFSGVGNLLGFQGVFVDTYAGNGPLWSLAYEIWFYVLAGALAAIPLLRGNNTKLLFCFLAIIASLGVFTKLNCAYLYIWLIGAAAYFFRDLIRTSTRPWIGFGLILFGIVACQLTSESRSINIEAFSYWLPSQSFAELLLGTGIAIFLPLISNAQPRNRLGAKLEEYGVNLAAFSYTLYLTHIPFIWCIDRFSPRASHIDEASIMRFLLMIIFSIAFAWLFYLLFEAQTGKVRNWVLNRI